MVDITRRVEALQAEMRPLVAKLKAVVGGPMPELSTGDHCSEPYDCPFLEHCQSFEPALPEFPLRCLPHLSRKSLARLTEAGYRDVRDVPEGELTSDLHKRVAAATRRAQTFVSAEFHQVLADIPYPRFFLDFETANFAIPRWMGTRPYQQLPFQFSCHRQAASGRVTHRAFLDVSGESPLLAFVDALLESVESTGPILVWNKGFEAGCLRAIAARFPKLRGALNRVIDRMVDLLVLYRKHYYHPDMRGSWSIKAVLPTVAPDLTYDGLDIAGGSQAQYAYIEAIDPATTAQRREEIRSQLLIYCERDTVAMIALMALKNPL